MTLHDAACEAPAEVVVTSLNLADQRTVIARIEQPAPPQPGEPVPHSAIVMTVRCPHCAMEHRHGVVGLPALLFGPCEGSYIVESATFADRVHPPPRAPLVSTSSPQRDAAVSPMAGDVVAWGAAAHHLAKDSS